MTAPMTGRSLLTSMLIAPLLSACGALPAGDTLAAPAELPTAPPPTRAAPDDPPGAESRVEVELVAQRKTKGAGKTKAARKTKAVARTDGARGRVVVETRVPPSTSAAVGGSRHLARLHPDVRRMARALHAAAAAEGIELTFISGYRAFDRHSKKARKGRASWHAFGMAFDVNLSHRKNMRDALAHYAADEKQWTRVGALAERLGLTWGLQWGRHEVFHFEWHPGQPEAIRRPTLTALLKDAGPDGRAIEKVWRRYWPVDGASSTADGAMVAHDHD